MWFLFVKSVENTECSQNRAICCESGLKHEDNLLQQKEAINIFGGGENWNII